MPQVTGSAKLREGNHFTGRNQAGLKIETDSRPKDMPHAGPNPMELLLISIAGCTGMEMLNILRKRKLEPDSLEIKATGFKRDEIPKIFTKIEISIHGSGNGITEKELNRAASLTFKNYCALTNMLSDEVQIEWRCYIGDILGK